ncbi:hypothetical protein [Moritella sp.]|uniref:hypothetical protein n=1 Tax=Moritella sp. TaxID=78556 RepID=UPI0025CC64FC|nr:hypothetical protein [Moritella sp.]MCJ8349062.1 hypothetical protein [Moritella sp.]
MINIRQQQPLTNYLTELESISTAMITEHWMIPMLHHRQTLYFQGVLKAYQSMSGVGQKYKMFGLNSSLIASANI